MPYITHPETRDIVLNAEGMLWVNHNCERFTYASVTLREQISILVEEILRVHNDGISTTAQSALQTRLFLKRKSAGTLRLKDENHHLFYKEGVLDLAMSSINQGSLHINILANNMYIHYIEFSYSIGTFN